MRDATIKAQCIRHLLQRLNVRCCRDQYQVWRFDGCRRLGEQPFANEARDRKKRALAERQAAKRQTGTALTVNWDAAEKWVDISQIADAKMQQRFQDRVLAEINQMAMHLDISFNDCINHRDQQISKERRQAEWLRQEEHEAGMQNGTMGGEGQRGCRLFLQAQFSICMQGL